MSQNKTKIQGLDLEEGIQSQQPFNQGFQQLSNSGLYSRTSHAGTVVSGMASNTPNAVLEASVVPAPKSNNVCGKPIVGFLYSISRTSIGEYWPLHIGSNTIGTSSHCDVVLAEGTVSGSHATLQVRRAKNTGKISAWISDTMSTNGTMVNDDCLGSTPMDCKNGDIITIGDNYVLYLVLIDASLLGLKVSEDFVHVAAPEPDMMFVDTTKNDTPDQKFDPWGTGEAYAPAPGTIGMDGSVIDNSKGGTKPL